MNGQVESKSARTNPADIAVRSSTTILCNLYDDGTATINWNGVRKLILDNFDPRSPLIIRCENDIAGLSLMSGFGDGIYVKAHPERQFELVVDKRARWPERYPLELVKELEGLDDENCGLGPIRISWLLDKDLDPIDGHRQTLAEINSLEDAKISISKDEPNTLIVSGGFQPCILVDGEVLRKHPRMADKPIEQYGPNSSFGCPYEMKGVAPFKLSKNDALDAYDKAIARRGNLPNDFAQRSSVVSVNSVFVPYWLLGGNGTYSITVWKTVNSSETSKDVFEYAEGAFSFKGIPADGSIRMNDASMDAINDYDFENLVMLDSHELSGHMVERFTDSENVIHMRMRNLLGSTVCANAFGPLKRFTANSSKVTIYGDWYVQQSHSAVTVNYKQAARLFVPVWIIETEYGERRYRTYVNGQTGTTSTSLPYNFEEVEYAAKQKASSSLKAALVAAAVCVVGVLTYWLLTKNAQVSIAMLAIIAVILGVVYMRSDALPGRQKTWTKKAIAQNEDRLMSSAIQYFDSSSFSCKKYQRQGPRKTEGNWPV